MIDKRGKLVTKRNKYGVSPAHERTVDGHVFASKREATRYLELVLAQRCGDISGLELQPRFKFKAGFSYVADFRYAERYRLRDGGSGYREVVEDVKGVQTDVFKLKRKCMAYFFPDVELRITK